MSFEAEMGAILERLRASDLLREPPAIAGAQGPTVNIGGRQVLNLCSNNYLGFAGDSRLANACIAALSEVGTGAAASRLISGTSTLHRDAEHRLATYAGFPAALLFSTGYAANVGTLQALAEPGDVIFSDRLNHASIIDGCRLSRARVFVYRHLELDNLRDLLRTERRHFRRAFVVTESLFSMDGDFAPLSELRTLCDEHDCGFVVDEAHAIGVFGPNGRGLCASAGVRPDVFVATLGKAFGVAGAFVAGSRALVRVLEHRARSYVFSTAAPPALAGAAIAACDLVEAANPLRARVLGHAGRLRRELRSLGYSIPDAASQIVPVHVGEAGDAVRLARALLEVGVFVQAIRPPTVPPGTSRLRIAPSAAHSDAQMETALDAFSACARLV